MQTTWPSALADFNACSNVCETPAPSIHTSAPLPPVSSLMKATGSFSREFTAVKPNDLAKSTLVWSMSQSMTFAAPAVLDHNASIIPIGPAPKTALAERAWRGGGNCYFDGKGTLLWEDEPEQLTAFKEFEHRLLWQKKTWLKEVPFPYVCQTQSEWQITDAFPNGGDLNKVFPPEQQEDSVYQYEGKSYHSRKIIGNGIYLRHVWGTLVPGFYANPQENHTAYATRWIYSPKERKTQLMLEFQNYSRSESDLAPRQGTWDYKCSRAWLNGQEIMPPVWENTNAERSNEITLKNENYMSRPAIDITLKKGWNKLMLKLPVGKFSSKETRLVKWMFTVAILDE